MYRTISLGKVCKTHLAHAGKLDCILLIGLGFIAWIDSLLNLCDPFGMLDLHAFDLDDALDCNAAKNNNRDPAPEWHVLQEIDQRFHELSSQITFQRVAVQ